MLLAILSKLTVVAASLPADRVMDGAQKSDLRLRAADELVDPVVYWVSSPVLDGESALLAGAGLTDARVRLCDTADACLAAGGGEPVDATAWEHSVRFSVGVGQCTKSPCWARLCTANTSACAAPVPLNAPDVWWYATPTPKSLRVFGRSLGWSGEGNCLNATTPLPTPSTRLVLSPGGPSVGATSATCFEATFPLHTLPPGVYPSAAVHTLLGNSSAMLVNIARPAPPSFPDLFDVDKSFNGSVLAALAAARASNLAKPEASAVVTLGTSRPVYQLDQPIEIPNRVTLVGASPDVSLIFNLSVPLLNCNLANTSCQWCQDCKSFPGAVWSAGSDWGLHNMTVLALAAPAPVYHNAAPIVWSHANSTRFTITGVTIRLAQVNMSNALRIDSSTYFTISNNTLIQAGSCVTSVQERFDSAVILYVSNSSDGWIQVRGRAKQQKQNCSWLLLTHCICWWWC